MHSGPCGLSHVVVEMNDAANRADAGSAGRSTPPFEDTRCVGGRGSRTAAGANAKARLRPGSPTATWSAVARQFARASRAGPLHGSATPLLSKRCLVVRG